MVGNPETKFEARSFRSSIAAAASLLGCDTVLLDSGVKKKAIPRSTSPITQCHIPADLRGALNHIDP